MAEQVEVLRHSSSTKDRLYALEKERHDAEITDRKLQRLVLLRDNDVISEEAFRRKALELAGV
jgi:hypothetical protein